MKSKQINFYLCKEDLYDLNAFLQSLNWGVFSTTDDNKKVSWLNEIPDNAFFALKHQEHLIYTKYNQNTNQYKVNVLESNVVEFWMSKIDHNTQTMYRGRLFLTDSFYLGDSLVEKNSEFYNATKNLFSWFKRYLKVDKNMGCYCLIYSKRAKEWADTNNGSFSLNNC